MLWGRVSPSHFTVLVFSLPRYKHFNEGLLVVESATVKQEESRILCKVVKQLFFYLLSWL